MRPIFGLSILVCVCFSNALFAVDVPAWRDDNPSTRFLGPDRFWRCRETLIFSLNDPLGNGFVLDVDVRDMNIYAQGKRPVFLWVIGPQGHTLSRELLEDNDPLVEENLKYQDGLSDMYGDLRYRAWHRHNSPGGHPPGKERSPVLDAPSALTPRSLRLGVAAAGPGVYRLMVVGTWDTWLSVTPSRPLAAAVSPGPGALYLHHDQLDDSWLYLPADTKDFGVTITEEVQPWSWSARILDESGAELNQVEKDGQFNYALLQPAKPDSLVNLRVEPGNPGACLHVRGAPMLLCPDASTARLFHGGAEVDARGRTTWLPHQRLLNQWVDGLTPAALAVDVTVANPETVYDRGVGLRFSDIPKLLDSQNLDPNDPAFGSFKLTGDKELDKKLIPYWRTNAHMLAKAATWKDESNPYYGHPGLVRRVMLYFIQNPIARQAAFFWYGSAPQPLTIKVNPGSFWGLPFRSNWYPLTDANFVSTIGSMREFLPYALSVEANAALEQSVQSWAIGRTVQEQGWCTNQWGLGLTYLLGIWRATHDYEVEKVLNYQIEYFTTPNALGKINPDTNYWNPGAADSGVVSAGSPTGAIPAEIFGHDAEYASETTSHLAQIHSVLPNQKIIDWLSNYYRLKTHLTLPRSGEWPDAPYGGTCSPTDSNTRTPYYTHHSRLFGAEDEVAYGPIWSREVDREHPWPVFEKESFVRSFDSRYHFIKTGSYYAIVNTGPSLPLYTNWSRARVADGKVDLIGYTGMHYSASGYSATKLGAISAVWIPDCGPVWLCQNYNVMYSHNVWGRVAAPICESWEDKFVEPTIVAEGMNQPLARFDAATRKLSRTTSLHYVPLTVTRAATFEDDGIRMNVEVTANEAFQMEALYESIPIYTDQRRVRLYDGSLAEVPYELPEALTPAGDKSLPPVEGNGVMTDTPIITCRVIDVINDAGAGAAIVFGEAHGFVQTRPVRYQKVAAATGGFNLVLPATWTKGQALRWSYRIVPHATPLDAAQLTKLTQ